MSCSLVHSKCARLHMTFWWYFLYSSMFHGHHHFLHLWGVRLLLHLPRITVTSKLTFKIFHICKGVTCRHDLVLFPKRMSVHSCVGAQLTSD